MRKVLLVASVQSHICQFHRPLVDMLHRYGFEVHAAAHDNLEQKPGLKLDFVDDVIEIPFVRNVNDPKNLTAYRAIKHLIDEGNYAAVHCNTPIAGVLTRLAAQKARRQGTKVIYTAHGFQFFKGSSKKDWMLYYPVERLMAKKTDLIFTINREDYEMAKSFRSAEVAYIPGVGVNTAAFKEAERIDIRAEFGFPADAFVVLTVGELFPRKNQKVLIDAMRELKDYPIYLVICGNGILHEELLEQCKRNDLLDKVRFAGYRRDIPNIMKDCDVFAFPSKREGLGLAGIEAMAAGLPLVASRINGILDYMIDGETGFLCDPDNSGDFAAAILKLYRDPEKRRIIAAENPERAARFDRSNSLVALEEGYRKIGII